MMRDVLYSNYQTGKILVHRENCKRYFLALPRKRPQFPVAKLLAYLGFDSSKVIRSNLLESFLFSLSLVTQTECFFGKVLTRSSVEIERIELYLNAH